MHTLLHFNLIEIEHNLLSRETIVCIYILRAHISACRNSYLHRTTPVKRK